MKKYSILIIILVNTLASALAQQSYTNPVIPGFHPDPSICRVGNDYYLVNSTFEYFPGVPLFHSKDLVNWEQIGHCLTKDSQLDVRNVRASGGVFAPCIRHHEGVFYMVTTNMGNGGNFFVYTEDPYGEWSEPITVKQSGIDPDLYFENGKCYFSSTGQGGIQMSEIDIKTGELLTEPVLIWTGTGGRYPEGPHIYKKDNWYYLLISEGGTEYGHKVTIARSRSIYGPYESNPANPILTHINKNAQNSPIQGTGHADIIQAHDNSWWIVFLGFRPQSGTHHLLGRETFLAPVTWEDGGWPVVNNNEPVTLEMQAKTLPLHPTSPAPIRTHFSEQEQSYEWTYLRNPKRENYSWTTGQPLRLKATTTGLDELASPTFIGRRQQHITFEATASVKLQSGRVNDEAGLSIFMKSQYHYDIFLKEGNSGEKLLGVRYRLGELEHLEKEVPVDTGQLFLRVKGNREYYTLSYSTDDSNYIEIGKMDTRFLSTETAGGFTGIFLSLYAVSASSDSPATMEIDWFDYKPLPDEPVTRRF